MMAYLYFLLLKFTAVLFTFGGTGLCYAVLKRSQLLDKPNVRSNHSTPTPRGGGIAVTFMLGAFLLVSGAPGALTFALFFLGIVSFIDDWKGLSFAWRLLAHFFAAFWCINLLEGAVFQGLLPPMLDRVVAAIIWVWIINLYNFMDGIDGITASQTIALGLGIVMFWGVSTIPRSLMVDAAMFASVGLGFIWWNWHRAKIFLGDVGSVPLGFMAGFLLLQLAAHGYPIAALILPAYYFIDSGITLLSRLVRGEKIWEAHSSHFYQKGVRGGLGHDDVSIAISTLNCALIALAGISTLSLPIAFVCLAVAYGSSVALAFYFAAPRTQLLS